MSTKKKGSTVMERLQTAVGGADGAIPGFAEFDMLSEPKYVGLVNHKAKLDQIKRYVEKQLKLVNPEVEIGLMAEGVKAANFGGFVLKHGSGRSPDKISATKLVELGVDVDVIARATVEGKSYTYAMTVFPKDGVMPTTMAEIEAMLPEDWQGE